MYLLHSTGVFTAPLKGIYMCMFNNIISAAHSSTFGYISTRTNKRTNCWNVIVTELRVDLMEQFCSWIRSVCVSRLVHGSIITATTLHLMVPYFLLYEWEDATCRMPRMIQWRIDLVIVSYILTTNERLHYQLYILFSFAFDTFAGW